MSTVHLEDHDRVRQAAEAGVRLTRRGQVVLALGVLGTALAAVVLLAPPAVSTDVPHHQQVHTVVVTPGDTVWEIAHDIAPGKDPRLVVAEIAELNGLSDPGSVRVGQPLYVPAG